MAAVFPLDTTKPWVFNGVTYEYDASEDRWYVVSTTATDTVVDSLGELERGLDVANSVIDQEIENRTVLLNVAAEKNNSQDASLDELSGRIDAIGANVGILEFKGNYQYRLERSEAACDAAYIACLAQANNDPMAMSECSRLYDECKLDIGNALPDGTFTSIGTIDQSATEELIISNTTQDGTTFDWENLLEAGDYLELVETTQNDSVLYEVISDPVRAGTEERIRVKHIKETGDGDGNFNLQEVSEIRVIKQSLGLDIAEADKRYVQRPYQVIFSSIAPTEGQSEDKVLRNGELWYDTLNLELFVWNNNAWVTATKPASQDIVVVDINSQVDALTAKAASLQFEVNTIIQETVRSPHLYYSDDEPAGNAEGNLIDGDLWVDSDDLQIKFYSQGAWINPDRTSENMVHGPATHKWTFRAGKDKLDLLPGEFTGPNSHKYNSNKHYSYYFHTESLTSRMGFYKDNDMYFPMNAVWGAFHYWDTNYDHQWKLKQYVPVRNIHMFKDDNYLEIYTHTDYPQGGDVISRFDDGRAYYFSIGGMI